MEIDYFPIIEAKGQKFQAHVDQLGPDWSVSVRLPAAISKGPHSAVAFGRSPNPSDFGVMVRGDGTTFEEALSDLEMNLDERLL